MMRSYKNKFSHILAKARKDQLICPYLHLFWLCAELYPFNWIRHFGVPLCLCCKASLSAKPFFWKWFHLHENDTACRTHFQMKGLALTLVLKRRGKRTRKWPLYRFKLKENSVKIVLYWDGKTPKSFQKTK